jgi:NFU1 iron-sulfur cluster scaffold homolog, mitochondrial
MKPTENLKKVTVTFEPTPNPAALKFLFSETIAQESGEFNDAQSTDRSPLAAKIFGFPWVSQVFIGPQVVTITKQAWVDWKVLSAPLSGLLAEHINSGAAVFLEIPKDAHESDQINENDSEIVKQIKRILASEIKPVVQLDGGDISFVKYENDNLYLQLKGACSTCPSSQATLKDGIEVRIKQVFPNIKEVLAI